jgi:D-arabinose 1-dehydrogenase-like Zn-dependent alcohol dehydrogenase
MPDDSRAPEAQLLCAGITTFNALRGSARGGDTVAVLGIGGLGHLGVQFAAKLGPAPSPSRAAATRPPHASSALTTTSTATARIRHRRCKHLAAPASSWRRHRQLGGDDKVVGGLAGRPAPGRRAAPEPIQVSPFQLIPGRRSVAGWPSGTAVDSEDTLKFSALTGVRPMIETYPLERAAEAYERMMSGKARFRVVIQVAS